jgi:transcriptional regulator with XRE-family HTH domain
MRKSIYSRQQAALCAFLKRARKGSGLTQSQMAAKLKKPQSFVAKYELGERRLDFVEVMEILDLLDVEIESLGQEIRSVAQPRG